MGNLLDVSRAPSAAHVLLGNNPLKSRLRVYDQVLDHNHAADPHMNMADVVMSPLEKSLRHSHSFASSFMQIGARHLPRYLSASVLEPHHAELAMRPAACE